jgi:hypothetical protein
MVSSQYAERGQLLPEPEDGGRNLWALEVFFTNEGKFSGDIFWIDQDISWDTIE